VGLTGLEPFAANPSWGHFDGKLGVEADVTSRSLVYATVQTGYLPGGYSPNPTTATFSNTVSPETLLSFTVGSKNRFFDNRFELNNEIYYYDYRHYIVQVINLVTGITSVYNAPIAIIYGDQVNMKWRIDSDSEVDLGANFMSAQFDRFILNGVNYHGFQLTDAPSVVVDAGGQHTFTLPNDATLVGRIDTHFENGHWGQFDHNPGTHQGAYTKTDLTLTYYPASSPWSVALWAKNLEDSAVFGATATSPTPGPSAAFIDPPRTFGVRVATKW
jgi:iron complex outermembrane receptor protein